MQKTPAHKEAIQQRQIRKRYVEQVILKMIIAGRQEFEQQIASEMTAHGCNPAAIDELSKLALTEYVQSIYEI